MLRVESTLIPQFRLRARRRIHPNIQRVVFELLWLHWTLCATLRQDYGIQILEWAHWMSVACRLYNVVSIATCAPPIKRPLVKGNVVSLDYNVSGANHTQRSWTPSAGRIILIGNLLKLTGHLSIFSATIYAFETYKLIHAIISSKLADRPFKIAGANSVHGDTLAESENII